MKIDEQLDCYKYKKWLFGYKASMQSFMTPPPECERNWSTLNQVHTKRRNHLSTSKLNSLVYIMYNRNLKYKHLKKQSQGDEVDPLIVEDMSSDDNWLFNPNKEDDGGNEIVEEESSRATRNGKSVERGLFDEEDEFEEESGSESDYGDGSDYDDFDY
ncbi:hypothetical protein C2S53_008886 [Perilla frutescens var. hirtella]|uniref:HAT C-terminal dimerisation domain-containing protein n=1 Tax=Perilla frutescens var. hirtella TaxID=608512 RepID=A0AAD4PBE2_PERFH|nr:hypothetical protein C2S53_008886 [Perilla frutescens var. hirtella]